MTENRILSALPRDELDCILPYLEIFKLIQGEFLYNSGAEIDQVFFPKTGICGLLSVIESGSLTQVAMVGSEGMLGVPVLLGSKASPHEVIVQVEGSALRITASALRREFERRGRLCDLLLREAFALLVEVSQSVSCNRFHTVEQRLSRWLLAAFDRARSDNLRLTEESLSHMVGARRQGVSQAILHLQKLGIVYHARGQIIVLDREKLESVSCECYTAAHSARDNFLCA